MSATIMLEEAQANLRELIEQLTPGEKIIIVSAGEPLATLIRQERKGWPCQPGSAKDTKHWMAPDFDAPLEDFHEYMQ